MESKVKFSISSATVKDFSTNWVWLLVFIAVIVCDSARCGFYDILL